MWGMRGDRPKSALFPAHCALPRNWCPLPSQCLVAPFICLCYTVICRALLSPATSDHLTGNDRDCLPSQGQSREGANALGASAAGPFKGNGAVSATVILPSREPETKCKRWPKVLSFRTAAEYHIRLCNVQVGGGGCLGWWRLSEDLAPWQLCGLGHNCAKHI